MITVHKHILKLGVNRIMLPVPHEILHVGEDTRTDNIAVWIRLDDSNTVTTFRDFLVTGTGHPTPHPHQGEHIGSVIQKPYAWHVFAQPIHSVRPW